MADLRDFRPAERPSRRRRSPLREALIICRLYYYLPTAFAPEMIAPHRTRLITRPAPNWARRALITF